MWDFEGNLFNSLELDTEVWSDLLNIKYFLNSFEPFCVLYFAVDNMDGHTLLGVIT